MDKRKEFEALLYETEYANIADSKYVEERLSLLRKWIKDNMPTKLYRYRRCNENSISAFSKDEIWGSSYLTFNDSLECIPCYDLNKVNDILNKEFDAEIIERNISQLKEGYLPSGIKELCSSEFINNLQNNAKQDISQKELEKQLQRLKNTLVTYISNNLSEYEKYFFTGISAAESQYMVACFSETNTSSLMWGHYADSHKGFCLEYDLTSIISDCAKDCKDIRQCVALMMSVAIAPVIYSKGRFDASSGFTSMLMNIVLESATNKQVGYYYADMLLPIKALLTKSDEWEYEAEWRMYRPLPSLDSFHQCIAKIKPTAVYRGIRMSIEDKKTTADIAKDKKIPCYQMVPQYFSSTYEIKPIDVSLLDNQ